MTDEGGGRVTAEAAADGWSRLGFAMGDLSWQDRAACRGRKNRCGCTKAMRKAKFTCTTKEPDDQFYPEQSSTNRGKAVEIVENQTKALCARCPVRKECLELGWDDEWGVWGGTLPRERAAYKRAGLTVEDILDQEGAA
jgi:hypothetical protein